MKGIRFERTDCPRTFRRHLVEKTLVGRCLVPIQLPRGGEEDGPRAHGEDARRALDELTDLLEQILIPDQVPHAEASGDKEGVDVLLRVV